jgi:hypothetical protein
MNQFSRRGFVKTLLEAAAGATPACSGLRSGVIPSVLESLSDSASVIVESGGQQLRLSPIGSPLTFQNFLRAGEQWKPATLPANPLVSGSSFHLVTSQMRQDANTVHCEGKTAARGLDGKPLDYAWKAEIRSVAENLAHPWIATGRQD